MKRKLILIWHLLRSKEAILATEDTIYVAASPAVISRTIYNLCCESEKEGIPVVKKMDSIIQRMDAAVEEVNNILNGIR